MSTDTIILAVATTKTALETVTTIHAALAAAGLPRTSQWSGGALTGWTECYGSTGFSVRQTEEGDLNWHAVVSGKPHLEYRDRDGGLHEPINPERLCPRIKAVFEAQGLKVKSVRYSGHQTMWDDDVEYDVVTARPHWLEAAVKGSRRGAW